MPNLFLYDNNIIKYKTLPNYEDLTLNFYTRTRKNPMKFKEFYDNTTVLRPIMHAGNLWDTIKRIFKKGKNIVKDTIDYVDNSPLLQTVKDIGFDVIKNKYGVDVNDYYNTAHDIAKLATNDSTDLKKTLTDTTQTVLNTTRKNLNDYFVNKNKDKDYKFDYKTALKNYYNDIMSNTLQPQQQQTVKSNYDLMANGVELSGELNNETIKRNLIKLLMVGNKTAAGNYTINKEFKPILLKHGLKTLTVPKSMIKVIDMFKSNNSGVKTESKESKGRLNLGGNKSSGSKNKIDRYNEILKKISK